ncbi:hypothetical protein SKAU_G00094670 [Synaphobranchus kaupii]|uniref:PiggyBac transposable element-derived protein domain-containing protein n=1 Tax=Synaphobranchus kaupii TaxID=118154 RepID=A0A9Q1J6I8_SYNKA|nr:hypothetical protein SKAU_G00094670 [Synaphobranchus kaupii]
MCHPARHRAPSIFILPCQDSWLFFSESVMKTVCDNTNKNGERRKAQGKKTNWFPVSVQEMYRYLSLVIYMGLLRANNMATYWSRNRLYKLAFTESVMPRRRFEVITWTLHMSDPAEDAYNDQKRGCHGYDRLFQLRPLLDEIFVACKAFYHPHQALSIDERMVASKNHIGLKQYMKAKPTKWGFKLFVLADSRNGYTCDFNIYQGKLFTATGKGLSFDAVVDLLDVAHLGTGYHIYVDNLYTSAALFRHLHQLHYGACGTIRQNHLGFPHAKNGLPKRAHRGAIRWLRDGPLLYTKWMDTREVTMCSTIHKVYSGDSVQRRVQNRDGTWTTQRIPIPAPVKAYNRCMGGVDLSDSLLKLYNVTQKTQKCFLLYKEMSLAKGGKPLTQRQFKEELCLLLADCGRAAAPEEPTTSRGTEAAALGEASATEEVECNPITIVDTSLTESHLKATEGRKYCVLCAQDKKRNKTIWKCESCNVPLCLTADRNCYRAWHKNKKGQGAP